MGQMINQEQVRKPKPMDLTPMENNSILTLKNVSIVEHVNLSVQLRLYLKKVKYQMNGVSILRSIMIGSEEISLAKLYINSINITAVISNSRFFYI